MTWSIIARDPATGAFGVAVATRFLAVGAFTPHADGGVGVLATQALLNPTYGPRGLRLLRDGVPAPDVVRLLTAADPGTAHRQLHVLDARGRIGVHTGRDCIGWHGHVVADGFSVAGNMLTGPRVVADTATAYATAGSLSFARRLITALEAGEAAGGDKRGKQSAALLIHTSEEHPALSLRVDDHPDPLTELRRLEAVSRERLVHFLRCLPTRTDPVGLTDRDAIEARIEAAKARDP